MCEQLGKQDYRTIRSKLNCVFFHAFQGKQNNRNYPGKRPQTVLWVELGKGCNIMRAHIYEHIY